MAPLSSEPDWQRIAADLHEAISIINAECPGALSSARMSKVDFVRRAVAAYEDAYLCD